MNFTRQAREYFDDVTVSIVTVPGVDVEACRGIANSLGVKFRVRN